MEKGAIVITGASGSMGSAAVKAVAKEGYTVVMACRNMSKGEAIRSQILRDCPSADIRLEQLDLSDRNSVELFVKRLEESELPLVGLFNNAGTMSRHYELTEEGFEKTMAVNFVGPVLLTEGLLPLLQEGARIVNMVSLTCKFSHLDKFFLIPGKSDFGQLKTYGKSKLALMLYTISLAQRTKGRFFVNMADPGIVNSNMISMDRWYDPLADLIFRPLIKSPENGVAPAVRALMSSEHGKLFVGKKIKRVPSSYAKMKIYPQLEKEVQALQSKIESATDSMKDIEFIARSVCEAVGLSLANKQQMETLYKICRREDTLYSYRNARIARLHGINLGCAISYEGSRYASMKKRTFSSIAREAGVNLFNNPDETQTGEYYIDSLFVDASYRGLSVGGRLISDALRLSSLAGYEKVTLIVDKSHSHLEHHYRTYGFRKFSETKFFGNDYFKMYRCIKKKN